VAFTHAGIKACSTSLILEGVSMRSIVFLSQKGGSGKTTIAVHVAVSAQQSGERVILVDTDPQSSASTWAAARTVPEPQIVKSSVVECRNLKTQGRTIAVIDTAPHSVAGVDLVASLADFILIPCRPSVFDLAATATSVNIAKAARRPAAFILNACAPRGPETKQAREVLKKHGFPIAAVTIGDRKAFSRAIITGEAVTEFEPHGKAAQEVMALWQWLKMQLGDSS
jgi:chromosome partitioning protein